MNGLIDDQITYNHDKVSTVLGLADSALQLDYHAQLSILLDEQANKGVTTLQTFRLLLQITEELWDEKGPFPNIGGLKSGGREFDLAKRVFLSVVYLTMFLILMISAISQSCLASLVN